MTDSPKPFILQRKHLGRIRMVNTAKKFGFITAENFREDVFFHFDQWEVSGPQDKGPTLELFVEFELDEVHRQATSKLRAKVVRKTNRPDGSKLDDAADPHLRAKHHPKARRAKPSWRKKDEPN